MPDHEIFKEHDPEDCFYSCRTVHDFMRLTDEMVHTIIGLEEELVRWRQALICFLASNFPHFHRYDSLKSALYIHAVSKNINTFPKNQGRIRATIAVKILDFTVMYR